MNALSTISRVLALVLLTSCAPVLATVGHIWYSESDECYQTSIIDGGKKKVLNSEHRQIRIPDIEKLNEKVTKKGFEKIYRCDRVNINRGNKKICAKKPEGGSMPLVYGDFDDGKILNLNIAFACDADGDIKLSVKKIS